jgi:galactonate dehydratase
MKIVKINAYLVRPRWCMVEILTDEGITGWGEAVIEGKASTVMACVNEMEEYLIGKDPTFIEDIWNILYRGAFYRGGPIIMSAIAGIDQALWDIKGKKLGVPVHELIGGKCRDKIKVYCWVGGDRPSDVAKSAREKMDEGFSAIKMNATEELQIVDTFDKVDAVLERVSSIRETCGKNFGIAIDFHGRVHKPMAKILAKKLEEFNPMFIEEPVLSEHMEEFIEIARCTSTPIATGERLFSKYDFKRLLSLGGVSIIQPDLSHAGGITEVRKISAMAEAYDVALAPHCPLGPIALSSCLQVDAVSYNAFIQEQSMGIHYNVGKSVLDYVKNKEVFEFKNGWVDMPKGAGLGVDVNKELIIEENKTPHAWKNPVWRHKDGSVAEW